MKVLTFKANGFMWFFMPLIVIYLSMPFLSLFVVNAKKIILDWYMVLGLVLPTISQILYPQSLRDSYYVFIFLYVYPFVTFINNVAAMIIVGVRLHQNTILFVFLIHPRFFLLKPRKQTRGLGS